MFGRGRGRRGFGKGFHNKNTHFKEEVGSTHDFDNPSGSGVKDRVRHPGHLRGKAIGMFYAKQSRQKKKDEIPKRSDVLLDKQKEYHLNSVLNEIEASDSSERASKPEFEEDEINNSFYHAYNLYLDESKLRNEGFQELYSPDTQSLKRCQEIDSTLKNELKALKQKLPYQRMLEVRKKLPSFKIKDRIIKLIEDNQVVVLSGETGCGKTTQVSQFILDSYISSGNGSVCRIVCTQPRRISAITVAERVAEERVEKCGINSSVGWQIRLEKKLPREKGSILYCTTGVMLQWLKGDSFLGNISHIILDEIHERDLDTDFLMIILKDVLVHRPDLKLVLMSATLNANKFSEYFGGCPMINIPGYTFPVQEYLLEDVLEMTGFVPNQNKNIPRWRQKKLKNAKDEDPEPFYRSLIGKYSRKTIETLRNWDEESINFDLIISLLRYICFKEKDGAILIFMPGWDQITKVNNLLMSDTCFSNGQFLILPLHSLMPTVNQREIFSPPPLGVRKIIIATNIAETSITINDVVFVIDCGKIKMTNFDVENNIETLKPEWVSLANAKQRKGRAGRVKPGNCYHFYTKFRENLLEQYMAPEILRTRLETMCLKIKILKFGKIKPFLEKAMNPPDPKSVEISIDLLKKLNALDEEESLTPLGFHLARLPMDPLTGRMILFGAIFSCLDPILTVAASLTFKDAFVVPLGKEKIVDDRKRDLAGETKSDHLMLAKAFYQWEEASKCNEDRRYCREYFLSPHTLKMLSNLKTQFAGYLNDLHFLPNRNPKNPDFNRYSDNEMVLKAVLCAGLYPNVGRIKSKFSKGKKASTLDTRQDGKVSFHPKSVNSVDPYFPSEWFVYYQKMKTSEIYLYDTTMVHPFALLFFGGHLTTGVDSRGIETVAVDKWIVFNCPSQTAAIVMKLRKELDKLLQYKIEHPEENNWITDYKSKEGFVIQSIVDLIMSEDRNVPQFLNPLQRE